MLVIEADQPPKIRKILKKIGSCNEKNHLSTKTLHWNRTWSYNPQNTSESRRNQGERHETLEKQGCRTQNVLKITIAGIGQGRQVAKEDRRRPVMLEEESCHRTRLHARLTRRRVGNKTDPCGGACGSCAYLPAIGLGGLGRRRPTHLPIWAVSPHAPSNCVFQNTNLNGLLCILRCPRKFSCFGSNLNPRL